MTRQKHAAWDGGALTQSPFFLATIAGKQREYRDNQTKREEWR